MPRIYTNQAAHLCLRCPICYKYLYGFIALSLTSHIGWSCYEGSYKKSLNLSYFAIAENQNWVYNTVFGEIA